MPENGWIKIIYCINLKSVLEKSAFFIDKKFKILKQREKELMNTKSIMQPNL
jgi:hypothetical protein